MSIHSLGNPTKNFNATNWNWNWNAEQSTSNISIHLLTEETFSDTHIIYYIPTQIESERNWTEHKLESQGQNIDGKNWWKIACEYEAPHLAQNRRENRNRNVADERMRLWIRMPMWIWMWMRMRMKKKQRVDCVRNYGGELEWICQTYSRTNWNWNRTKMPN